MHLFTHHTILKHFIYIVPFLHLQSLLQTINADVNIPRNTEQKLSDLLFQNYSAYGRPVLKLSSPINATFGIELMQLISVNERHQYIRTKLWVRQNWHNEQLKWDPSDFDGLDILHVNAKQVWKPDVVLYNNADDGFNGGTEKYRTLISIHANGTSVWLAPATFTSTCSMDVRYFPFDLQICKLKFGSWSYDVTKVQLNMDEKDLLSEKYINSSEWDIVTVNKTRNVVRYLCCPDPYHDVTFTFILRRRPLYFVFNVIAPCVVLVIMILFSFFLPPESGERISLTITVLLAFAVFLQVISASLPKNADSTPILSVFYMSVMAESALSLITTCIVLCIHHKGSEKGCQPLPMWVRRIFFRDIPKEIGFNHYSVRKPSDTVRELFSREFCMYQIIQKFSNNGNANNNNSSCPNNNNNNNEFIKKKCHCDTDSITKVNYSLHDILDELHKINDAILNQEKEDEIAEDWKIFGRFIDKIFFYMFLVTFLMSAAGTLLPVYLRKEY